MKNKVNIKGTDYKIIAEKPNRDYLGVTNYKKKTIKITTYNEGEEIKKTIIHELLHAYMHECGLIQYESDETIILFLENIFTDLAKKANQATKIFNQLVTKDKGAKNGR